MKCETCNLEITQAYGSGRFCSKSCANRFSSTVNKGRKNEKISKALKGRPTTGGWKSGKVDKEVWKKKIDETWKRKRLAISESLPFEELSDHIRRQIVFEEQEESCAKCKIKDWLGEHLSFELDHKDGKRDNNTRENLEILCPNCHSQTPTWRGRNKSEQARKFVPDEEYIKALTEEKNIRNALIKLGLAPKGGNYFRAKRLLDKIDPTRRRTE